MTVLISIIAILLFCAPAWATDYYVATTGNDSNTCTQAQSILTPKLTIASGSTCLSAGDTLQIRVGTYTGPHGSGMPSGTNWSSPITYKAYNGEAVTWAAPATDRALTLASSQHHLIFDDIIFDGAAQTGSYDVIKITYQDPGTGAHHIRIQNSEIKNAGAQAVLLTGKAEGTCCVEILNNTMHGNGRFDTNFMHAVYSQVDDVIIKGNDIYNQSNGQNVHIFYDNASNNIIANNRLHDRVPGGTGSTVSIIAGVGTGHKIYNNIFYGSGAGINIDYGTSAQAYNNTIYGGNIAIGAESAGTVIITNNLIDVAGGAQPFGIGIYAGASNTTVQNNLVIGGAFAGCGAAICNLAGKNTTLIDNITSGSSLFTNPGAADFTIQSGSTARNAGVSTSPTVIDDFAGISRPQGPAYDIGAYEYVVSGHKLNATGKWTGTGKMVVQ